MPPHLHIPMSPKLIFNSVKGKLKGKQPKKAKEKNPQSLAALRILLWQRVKDSNSQIVVFYYFFYQNT